MAWNFLYFLGPAKQRFKANKLETRKARLLNGDLSGKLSDVVWKKDETTKELPAHNL